MLHRNPRLHRVSLLALAGMVWLVGADTKTLKVYGYPTGKRRATLTLPQSYSTIEVAFVPKSTVLVIQHFLRKLQFWDWKHQKRRPRVKGHQGELKHLQFDKRGAHIASVGSDEFICKWETRTGNALQRTHLSSAHSAGFRPNGSLWATSVTYSHSKIWRIGPKGKSLWWALKSPNVAVAPDGQKGIADSNQKQLFLLDIEKKQRRPVLPSFKNMHPMFFAKDALHVLLATAVPRFKVRVWRQGLPTPYVKLTPELYNNRGPFAISPKSRYLGFVKNSDFTQAVIQQIPYGKTLASWLTRKIHAIAFSNDGKLLATGHDRMIILWDISTKHPTIAYKGHDGIVTHLAFSPDGKHLASAGYAGSILLWSLPQRKTRK